MPEQNEKEQQPAQKKHRKDTLSGIEWGLIVILLGVIFLLRNMGYIRWGNWWAYLLLGIGVILIIDAIIRITLPQYGRVVTGRIIGGIVLLAIGAGNIYGIGHWWPMILVAVGLAVIISALLKTKQPEEGA